MSTPNPYMSDAVVALFMLITSGAICGMVCVYIYVYQYMYTHNHT